MVADLVLGTGLVLLSWAFFSLIVISYGRWLAVWILPPDNARADFRWRVSIWFGLAVIATLVVLANQLYPLGETPIAVWTIGLAVLLGSFGVLMHAPGKPTWSRPSLSVTACMAALAVAVVYLAAKALGPATNYDTGLYHLGSVKYAQEFAAIPGIANVYFPFGYANTQFPLAALLGNGPWEGTGYRLLNGLVVLLVSLDLFSRLLNGRWTWGTFTLLFGLSATCIPMVAMADAIVTSPTADTSVMLLSIVSASYLADAIQPGRSNLSSAPVSVLLAVITVAFRPTMIIFALGTLTVALILYRSRRSSSQPQLRSWLVAGTLTVFLGLTMFVRDRTLSGWIMYPLSVFPFDVPWIAEDPTRSRIPTLAAARDPFSNDGYVTAHSWNWLAPWFERLPSQWEPWFILTGAIAALSTLVIAKRMGVMVNVWRSLALAMAPSWGSVVIWFVFSPPSFRFAWGPLFALIVIPMGVAFAQMVHQEPLRRYGLRPRHAAFVGSALCVLTVTVFSLIMRNQFDTITESKTWVLGSLSVPYATAPMPLPPVRIVDSASSFSIVTPVTGDQCWDNFPLCTPYTSQSLVPRGSGIQDGFLHE